MGDIYDRSIQFLRNENWNFTQSPDGNMIRFGFNGHNGNWNCFIRMDEDKSLFMFYSVLPVNIPEPKRAQISEFITRANYDLLVGNFEMDLRDGEVRYKTSIDFADNPVGYSFIHRLIYGNLLLMDTYFSGFMNVCYSDVEPEEAIQKIENKPST